MIIFILKMTASQDQMKLAYDGWEFKFRQMFHHLLTHQFFGEGIW